LLQPYCVGEVRQWTQWRIRRKRREEKRREEKRREEYIQFGLISVSGLGIFTESPSNEEMKGEREEGRRNEIGGWCFLNGQRVFHTSIAAYN
jgi:hypothetical protein